MPQLLTTDDVASALAVSASTIRKMARDGELPQPIRVGGRLRFRADDVRAWLLDGCPDLSVECRRAAAVRG